MRANIITLGCSKNLVDSERVLKLFSDAGIDAVHEAPVTDGDIVIINTCGFIGDAKEESINTILEYAQAKINGDIERLYVMGCLSERYSTILPSEITEVDKWYGKFDWTTIVSDILETPQQPSKYSRTITTPSHYAYIKISEGCNRFCAFCAIPLITGRHTSRPIDEIVEEVKTLVSQGVKEFNIIAQDLSSYGIDIYGKLSIAQLIDTLADIDGVKWIRLHYAYPSQFPLDLLDVMARRDNVCKYLDIALQHINNEVLHNMQRHISTEETKTLISEMRNRVPGLHLRTTLMVGFPGEGDKEFDELVEFIKETKFERMGAFAYCEEEDTYAARHYTDNISDEIKQERLSKLMEVQEDIALDLNLSKIGQKLNVIIDREEDDYYIGRTQWDSPEVDPEVLIKKTQPLLIGEFYNVLITSALPFELIAQIAD